MVYLRSIFSLNKDYAKCVEIIREVLQVRSVPLSPTTELTTNASVPEMIADTTVATTPGPTGKGRWITLQNRATLTPALRRASSVG